MNWIASSAAKVKPGLRRGFTLIERVPRNNANTWRMKGTAPVNRPLKTGSLTAEFRRSGTRSAVTKSRERKLCRDGGLWPAPKALRGNAEPTACRSPHAEKTERLGVSQSGEANPQAAGKRTSISIVKSTLAGIADRASESRVASRCSIGEANIHGEDNGTSARGTRRCQRRRHVGRVNASNWGGPARFPSADGIRDGIRTTSESRREAVPGVGDAHSSDDQRDSKTRWERRGISLKTTSDEERPG